MEGSFHLIPIRRAAERSSEDFERFMLDDVFPAVPKGLSRTGQVTGMRLMAGNNSGETGNERDYLWTVFGTVNGGAALSQLERISAFGAEASLETAQGGSYVEIGRWTTDDAEDSTTQLILNLNQQILEAEEEGREADLEPLLTDDFWIVRGSGVKQNRQDYLNDVKRNANLGRTADQTEVRLCDECAVYTCLVTTTRTPEDGPGGRFWNTRLFERDGEGWRCAAWQVTKISEA